MGILNKLKFWKKKELPGLPEEEFQPELSPVEIPRGKPFSLPESPTFEPIYQPQLPTNEFQVISSKLDVLNAKIEVLNEKITNLERSLHNERVRW